MNSSITYYGVAEKFIQGIKKPLLLKFLLAFLLLIWCTGFLFPVLTPQFAVKPLIGHLFKYSYSLVCHQSETATLQIGGVHLLVCARCSGLYLGALLTSVFMIFKLSNLRLSLKPLIIFSFPLIFDAIAVRIHLYAYSKTLAFSTGLLCGTIILIYIFETLDNQSKNAGEDV